MWLGSISRPFLLQSPCFVHYTHTHTHTTHILVPHIYELKENVGWARFSRDMTARVFVKGNGWETGLGGRA